MNRPHRSILVEGGKWRMRSHSPVSLTVSAESAELCAAVIGVIYCKLRVKATLRRRIPNSPSQVYLSSLLQPSLPYLPSSLTFNPPNVQDCHVQSLFLKNASFI
jgi:hypothetical protein